MYAVVGSDGQRPRILKWPPACAADTERSAFFGKSWGPPLGRPSSFDQGVGLHDLTKKAKTINEAENLLFCSNHGDP